MAVSTTDSNLQKKIYSQYVFHEGLKNSFFGKFMSKKGDSVIRIYDEFKSEKGASIRVPLLNALSTAPVTGDTVAITSPESMGQDYTDVTIDQYRFPVAFGRLANQQAPWQYGEQAKNLLKDRWINWQDDTFVNYLTTSPTTNEVLYAPTSGNTAVAATASLEATCYMTLNLAITAKVRAQTRAKKIEPVMIDGRPYYIMLIHPYALRDLYNNDATFRNIQYYAAERGSSNPLISGANAYAHGILFYEYERVRTSLTGASSANVCFNMLLGKNAGIMAVANDYTIDIDTYDGGNQTIYFGRWMGGIAKTKFTTHAADWGCIQVQTGGATS